MNAKKVAKKYLITGFSLIGLLYIICIGVENIFDDIYLGWAPTISFIYTFITLLLYGLCWEYIATKSPRNLSLFYMASSLIRMFLAVPFVVGYWIKAPSFDDVFLFVIVFITFYLVMLAFDAIFFARVEKHNKKEQLK